MTGPVHRDAARVAILGSGAGTTADAVIQAFIDGRTLDVVLLLGNNSRSGIFKVAARHGIPAAHISGATHPAPLARDLAMHAELAAAQVNLILLAGYMKMLGPAVLASFSGQIINTHPLLLPAYGSTGMFGDHVHAAVLRDGILETRATLHTVTGQYDEGPILAQRTVPVLAGDDVHSLRRRVQDAEKEQLVTWLTSWATKRMDQH